ncbi:outer membrane receptor protein [Isoalcanivorax pacificus W11-5]|uniref:Outer membrane receptor protein n=1 Tax=Isoalcanivorax pacificus W11-5 TaxID=391936 RepID=A0A0B4XND7_9GAMM|nr:major capsid protein P2 [Isoalcanivorax pacificus]AJD48275.1 outer membrane receptor protein [Isoalcanivorax pacificus W11-5]
MLRVPREVKSFDGVGWGQKPQVKLAGGPTYHEIVFETNLLPEQIVMATLWLNGDPIVQMTGQQMVMLERYKKHWEEPGRFVMPLADISGASLEGQSLSALPTFPADNLILQVQVAQEPAPNTQGSVALKADAWVSRHVGVRSHISRITTTTFNAGANGRNILDTLPNNGQLIRRMHLLGDIANLRIRKDKNVVYEQDAGKNVYHLKRRKLAPQAGYYHFDPVQSHFIRAEQFDTRVVESLEFEMDVSTPGNIAIFSEVLEPLKNPVGVQAAA